MFPQKTVGLLFISAAELYEDHFVVLNKAASQINLDLYQRGVSRC